MNIEQVQPELRPVYAKIPSIPFHNPVLYFFLNGLQKFQSRKIKPVPGIIIEDKPINFGSVRIYRPEKDFSGTGLLWIHGGGYILGNASINDRECCNLVKELGLMVVSVDYRLAPKHPFPAALDDCFDAWQYMQEHADQWGLDPARIAVMGQSAGGGLAASVVQRIADSDGVQPAAQLLVYPMIDDYTATHKKLDSVKHRLWNNKNNRGAWRWYLGCPAGTDSLPAYAAAARREDLSGLPATWVGVGDLDLFYQENCQYADRLREAGVSCELHVTPQAPHAFDILAPKTEPSQKFIQDYFRFLRDRLF